MDTLFRKSDRLLASASTEIVRGKDVSQIAGVKDSYVFADDWDMPDGAKLPLWMLGFLY